MASMLIKFDPENKQKDFRYMARNKETGKWEVGYVVIDRPWFAPEDTCTCYIVSNKYGSGGICGGCSDLGFQWVAVDRNTVVPYTQTMEIRNHQDQGITVELVKDVWPSVIDDKNNMIAVIRPDDEIPYELWNGENK